MDVKGTLKALTLEFRRELEGKYDAQGTWQAGDLERRLAAIGVRRDRAPVPVDELPHLAPADREARRVVDAFLQSRAEAGQNREATIAEFVRDAAYTWANRLLALRCMEARALIDEVILQKEAYGDRSLQHNRLAKKQPERCAGEDEGLFAALFDEFSRRAEELPLLFDPRAPEVALRPSVAAVKRCVALLSGTLAVKAQEAATDEVFTAPDALGWTYQYWNTEEKDRVFEKVRTKKGSKIEGAEIVPATCIYTEPYMVKFLVQNSLGAIWMGMHPDSRLFEKWQYYVRDADRAPVSKKAVSEITFLDPACGSGHFLIEAFELFYAMYVEESALADPAQICASILERNLYGIDIDERAAQIAALALVMKAKEKAPNFVPRRVNLVATNIRLPAGKEHLEVFLAKHPEDVPLKSALLAIFEGLAHADELGSLLQIEEPVDRELRHLRDQQIARERKAGAGTLFGPRKDEEWSAWKHEVIERLREHFSAEAKEADLAAAFFGEAASKGISLVDLLARRYDVVAANPPYMGSKNMGELLKDFVGQHYPSGKRDLYAAFILRCLNLATDGGITSMVTPQSWMFIRSYAYLRAFTRDTFLADLQNHVDSRKRGWERAAEDLRSLSSLPAAAFETHPRVARKLKESNGFRGLLNEATLHVLVHLGPGAFEEIGGEVVNVALFVVARSAPSVGHRFKALRLAAVNGAEEKAAVIRRIVAGAALDLCFEPPQNGFANLVASPIAYWLRDRFLALLASAQTVASRARVMAGLKTADDERFVRCFWEVSNRECWPTYAKGGGYSKWAGQNALCAYWGPDADIRYAEYENARSRNPEWYRRGGYSYSELGGGALGVRELLAHSVFGNMGPAVFPNEGDDWIIGLLNSRPASYLARALNPGMHILVDDVQRIPAPAIDQKTASHLRVLVQAAIRLKSYLANMDPREATFSPAQVSSTSGDGLIGTFVRRSVESEAVSAVLHTVEGELEYLVQRIYGLDDRDCAAVVHEMGIPPGWRSLVEGFDKLPAFPDSISLPAESLSTSLSLPRRALPDQQLVGLMQSLRALYEQGPGGSDVVESGEESLSDTEDEDDNGGDEPLPSSRHIPSETLLEELALKLEVHPLSVYSLLQDLREKDSVVCKRELVRFTEDYVSVLVLRLLGHRWPREIEAGGPVPAWVDGDGVIALTDGTGESRLLARIRDRLAEDFGRDRVGAIEREFEEVVGRPLGAWLASDFFRRHISQFRKRPVAVQIVSSCGNNDRHRGRGAGRNTPAFSCLVYYHRVDADLLPKLRTQYVGPLRTSLQTELGSLEKLKERSANQDARRLELEEKLEEIKAFDARLEHVVVEGFASTALDKVAVKEPLDKWTSRDGRARAPETRDALLAQERRYDTDLNDGVRVNIAPLQRAGLLAADVLAAKDMEKAIADRAEWRTDERRWCREGKLPQPGWWGATGDRR